MVCDINDLNITEPEVPNFGRFALNLSSLGFDFPTGIPEDLLDLFDKLSLLLPSGPLKPGLSPNFGKTIFDAILSLLEKLAPFLYLYKFILPILNMIICIIEVLCAIPNPFKLRKKLRRLFRICLPEFLSLFPILALLLMILSLIKLIIALIQYLIAQVLRIIQLILKNIKILTKAIKRNDADSILAATRKLGILLCFIQNLFVILGAIATIIALIKAMLNLAFNLPPCGDSGNLSIDEACCSSEVCPDFIKNHETIQRKTGTFIYGTKVYQQITLPSGFPIPQSNIDALSTVYREEYWHLYDKQSQQNEEFNNIVNAYDVPPAYKTIFFPNATFDNSSDPKKVPYKVDIKFTYDPTNVFWNSYSDTSLNRGSDPKGIRKIIIKDCIVSKPTIEDTNNGTLILTGGKAYEEDLTTPVKINGKQATLNTFFSVDYIKSNNPVNQTVGSITYNDVEYTFYINHESLAGYSLITIGCFPDVSLDKDTINTTYAGPIAANTPQILDIINDPNKFPDIALTSQCVLNSINKFRTDVSTSGAAVFESEITTCLNDLINVCKNGLPDFIRVGYDPYKSTFELDPTLQFTTKPIKVKVNLNDVNGLPLASGLDTDTADVIANDIIADITFGQISNFKYDGTESFLADITSDSAGKGKVKIEYGGKIIGTTTVPTDLTQPIIVTETQLEYEFIYADISVTGEDVKPRRTETDTAGDVSNG